MEKIGFGLLLVFFILWIIFIQTSVSKREVRCKIIKEKVMTTGNRSRYYFIFTDNLNKRVFLQDYLSKDVNDEYCY